MRPRFLYELTGGKLATDEHAGASSESRADPKEQSGTVVEGQAEVDAVFFRALDAAQIRERRGR